MLPKFKEFLSETHDTDAGTAHFFDMDDTLFHHEQHKLRVHVNDQHGRRVRTLSNHEYNTHELPEGHHYDFGEFKSSDVFKESAKPIKKMINKLKAIHNNGGKTEIVTARQDLDDKDKFAHHLKKFGIDIDKIHVHRAGNLKGKASDTKAQVIHDLISKHGYNKVHLYDDAPENLDKFLKLKSKHPEVEFHAHHVDHDPETGHVNITTRNA